VKVDGRLWNVSSELALEVTVQFKDVVTGHAFATLAETSSIWIVDSCAVSCAEQSLNREIFAMGHKLTSRAIIAMQSNVQRADYSIADVR
jgi:hypothetical protein